MRKLKRTAGQRRYLQIKRKADGVRADLTNLQSSIRSLAQEGKQLTQIYIMQKVTEAIERLK